MKREALMAAISIHKRETNVCAKCGNKAPGVLFSIAEEIVSESIRIDPENERFLCDDHFDDFIATNGHRVTNES